MNPVKAEMVKEIHEYLWSSYHHNALGEVDQLVTEHPLYLELGSTKEESTTRYKLMMDKMVLGKENQNKSSWLTP